MRSRNRRPVPATRRSSGHHSGSQYALCTLAVGLVALGVVMIVWSAIPPDAARNVSDPSNNNSTGKTSIVAYVLVGAGAAMLALSICLGVRSKYCKQPQQEMEQGTQDRFLEHRPGDHGDGTVEAPNYDVPTYEEAVNSGRYPVRQSNLRVSSSSQLPSYEDLVDAVDGEAESAQPVSPPPAASSVPQRHDSLTSRLFRPLRVRRIKSEKLHLKDLRLEVRPGERITIEPLTPPPQYDEKPLEI